MDMGSPGTGPDSSHLTSKFPVITSSPARSIGGKSALNTTNYLPLDCWLFTLTKDIEHIKNFICETNKLLTTLVEAYRNYLPLFDPISRPNLTQSQQMSQTNSKQKDKRNLVTNLRKRHGKTVRPSKLSKLSKNIKRPKFRQYVKMNFSKLFKILESLVESKGKQQANYSSQPKIRDHVKRIIDPEILRVPAQLKDPKTSIHKQTTPNQTCSHTDTKRTKTQTPTLKWQLKLVRRKLVLTNYLKPPGHLTQWERKIHLLKLLNSVLPDRFLLSNISSVEYLYYNRSMARAVVMFDSWEKADLLLQRKMSLWHYGIEIKRFFMNIALPQALCLYFPTKNLKENVNAKHLTKQAESNLSQDVPLHLDQTVHSSDSIKELSRFELTQMSKTEEETGPYIDEEVRLLEAYIDLSSGAQFDIVQRLQNLTSLLISKSSDDVHLNHPSEGRCPAETSLPRLDRTLEPIESGDVIMIQPERYKESLKTAPKPMLQSSKP
ncbi:fatty acid-binding protein, liver isoform X1 [Rhineura floridana]|uniref:fatty acid-binding protein, liver isoform X1 n=1 Tax=Rhineura floridana TaxID=261503 RepID=UPI002AC82B95|nr:fatty acid-binding protein, liver isoform X1 [Rhineura floridana]